MPAEYALSAAAGAAAVHAGGPRLDRHPGRRRSSATAAATSSQNAMLYENLAQRFGARASTSPARRSSSPAGQAGQGARDAEAAPRQAPAQGLDRPLRASPRSSASMTPTTRRRRRRSTASRSPTRRCRRRARPWPRRSRCPTRAPCSTSTTSSAARRPAAEVPTGDCRHGASARSACAGHRGQRRTGAARASHATMSNALLVSARDSASGHPLAVMGPQVSYFSPEILMEEDIHGPGIDADGAAFAGANLYVELGHGTDYAWSATSAGQNIIDTFAVPLCNPGGGAASIDSDYYLLHGRCVRDADPDRQRVVDAEPRRLRPRRARSRSRPQRTAFGIVIARATDPRPAGRVHATCARPTCTSSTRRPASPQFNDPAEMRDPAGLLQRRRQGRLHVQLVLRQRQAHRLLQLGREPGARAAHRPAVPDLVAVRLAGATTPAPSSRPAA